MSNRAAWHALPFLQVLTRSFGQRPNMLAENIASLQRQTDPDLFQTIIKDDVGRGVAWACRNLSTVIPDGQYIWILDDDDLCICDTLVAEVKAIAYAHDPGVIFLRMDHGPLGILPDDAHWQRAPVEGHIGCSAFVVRRDVWIIYADWWSERYAGDFDFISAVYADPEVTHFWHDRIASRVQRRSMGAPEYAGQTGVRFGIG